MKSTDKASLTIVQMNDTHAYFDLHQEIFWQGDHAEYRQAGGYARIATIVKQIRAESQGNCLFCDCDAIRKFLTKHHPIHAELRGSYVVI